MEACQTRRAVLVGKVQGRQDRRESHLVEDQSGSGMDQGHQGHRKEDSHQAESDHVGESSGVVVDAADLVEQCLDEAGPVVPDADIALAMERVQA